MRAMFKVQQCNYSYRKDFGAMLHFEALYKSGGLSGLVYFLQIPQIDDWISIFIVLFTFHKMRVRRANEGKGRDRTPTERSKPRDLTKTKCETLLAWALQDFCRINWLSVCVTSPLSWPQKSP